MNKSEKIAFLVIVFALMGVLLFHTYQIKQLRNRVQYIEMWLGGERIPYSIAEEQFD